MEYLQEILNDPKKLDFIKFGGAATILLSIGFIWFMHVKKFVAHAIKIDTKVLSYTRHSGGNNSSYYMQEVEFKTDLNEVVKTKVKSWHHIEVGNDVTILYDPNNPEKAKCDDKLALFVIPVVLCLIGAGFAIAFTHMYLQGLLSLPF